MAIQKFNKGPIRQVYKNLYFDTTTRMYYFIDENNRRPIASQEGYLLIYIIELLKEGRNL